MYAFFESAPGWKTFEAMIEKLNSLRKNTSENNRSKPTLAILTLYK